MTSIQRFFCLNLLDAAMTVIWHGRGWASEWNFLMAALLQQGVMIFVLTKLLMGMVVCAALRACGDDWRAEIVADWACAIYALLIVSHLFILLMALQGRV